MPSNADANKKGVKKELSEKSVNRGSVNAFDMYMREIRSIPVLSRQETLELFLRYKQNNDMDAHNKLIRSNLKLVVTIVKKYGSNSNDYMDLVQEGNMGLMQAIDRYEPARGFALSTAISCWVNKYIKEYIQRNRLIREPDSVYRLKKRVEKSIQDYYQVYGNENPTEIELHEFNKDLSLEDIRKAAECTVKKSIISLDAKMGDCNEEESECLAAYIACEDRSLSLENIAEKNELHEMLEDALSCGVLSEKERRMLIHRYGFEDGDFKSQKRTSEFMQIARQRVSRVETHSFEKLRASEHAQGLSELL